jgi:hypothetical protein
VELDVLVVKQPDDGKSEPVEIVASQVIGATECKAFSRSVSSPSANEAIGKALRIWGQIPTGKIGSAARYALVHLSGITEGARQALKGAEISHLDARISELPDHIRELVSSL